MIPEITQENLATAPVSANTDRFQARHRQQLCLGRQIAASAHIIRCFLSILESDPNDDLAATLASLGRMIDADEKVRKTSANPMAQIELEP